MVKRWVHKTLQQVIPPLSKIPLTHQQFVNDVILYGQETLKEVKKIMEILTDIICASGIEISNEKSEIYFFINPNSSQTFMARIVGFRIGNFPTKYLGILLNDQQNGVANWSTMMGKVQRRMQNWTFRALNISNHIIILKSMLQSILIYQLTSQATPKTISHNMVDMFKNSYGKGLARQRNGHSYAGAS